MDAQPSVYERQLKARIDLPLPNPKHPQRHFLASLNVPRSSGTPPPPSYRSPTLRTGIAYPFDIARAQDMSRFRAGMTLQSRARTWPFRLGQGLSFTGSRDVLSNFAGSIQVTSDQLSNNAAALSIIKLADAGYDHETSTQASDPMLMLAPTQGASDPHADAPSDVKILRMSSLPPPPLARQREQGLSAKALMAVLTLLGVVIAVVASLWLSRFRSAWAICAV